MRLYEEDLTAYDGERIRVYCGIPEYERFRNPIPAIIMTHGYTSKGKNKTNLVLAEWLIENGIATFIFDLSGHGESSGNISNQTVSKAAIEVQSVYKYVQGMDFVNSNMIGLFGSSFSGTAILHAAANLKDVYAVFLKSPITDYYDTRLHQLGDKKMEQWKKEGEIILNDGTKSNVSFIDDIMNINTYIDLKAVEVPVIVVQGSEDEDVTKSQIERLRVSLNTRKDRLYIIDGANHSYKKVEHFNEMISIFMKEMKGIYGLCTS